MHECISPGVRDDAAKWFKYIDQFKTDDCREWGTGVHLAMTAPETGVVWMAAVGWWADNPHKGQHYLLRQVRSALVYRGGTSPRSAQQWRERVLEQLQALSELVTHTPDQYLGWWVRYGDSEGERIAGLQSAFSFPELPADILNNEGLSAALLPQDAITAMQQALLAQPYQQGDTPLKPADIHAKRAYFVRRLCATLSPVTHDWPDIIRALALGIFASDLKRSQVIALAQGVRPDSYEKESFERMYLAENKQ